MSLGDLSRVNTNVQSMRALSQLNKTNGELGMRQMRLATGSRLNRAEDDSAGYAMTKKLEAKVRGQNQALANIGDAKGLMTVAEGSLNSIMDILQTMKEKTVQAANDTLGTSEREAIGNQLTALQSEINDIVGSTSFNGHQLLDGTGGDGAGAFSFQIGDTATDTFAVDFSQVTDAATLGVDALDVSDAANAATAIQSVDDAIQTVADRLAGIGDDQSRLSFKQDNLQTSINNYESSKSRITDADFAKEQMEIVKLQILQQTGIASLAQANAAPQSVLSLLG